MLNFIEQKKTLSSQIHAIAVERKEDVDLKLSKRLVGKSAKKPPLQDKYVPYLKKGFDINIKTLLKLEKFAGLDEEELKVCLGLGGLGSWVGIKQIEFFYLHYNYDQCCP